MQFVVSWLENTYNHPKIGPTFGNTTKCAKVKCIRRRRSVKGDMFRHAPMDAQCEDGPLWRGEEASKSWVNELATLRVVGLCRWRLQRQRRSSNSRRWCLADSGEKFLSDFLQIYRSSTSAKIIDNKKFKFWYQNFIGGVAYGHLQLILIPFKPQNQYPACTVWVNRRGWIMPCTTFNVL